MNLNFFSKDKTYRHSLICFLFLGCFLSFDFGITWDEYVQSHYGDLVLQYFTSFFSDDSHKNYINLHLYGGLFDLFSSILHKAFQGIFYKYETRHLFNFIVAWIGVVYASRLAKKFDFFNSFFDLFKLYFRYKR